MPFITNEKEGDIFIRQLLNIGEAMYQSGGEISRIEDSLHRLGKKYGAKHVSVYAITSSIVLTAEFENDFSITQIRRITQRGSIDCLKMEKLNQLCRDCEGDPIPVSQLQEKVLAILSEQPDLKGIYWGQLLAVVSFAFFFGGNWKDALVAAVGVGIICLMQRFVKRFCSAELFFILLTSFVTGTGVNFISLFVKGLHVNQILISDIMVLIPGIAITNSIRYILSGDIISSFEKLMDSLLQAFGIAAGFMLSFLLVRNDPVSAAAMAEPYKSLVQITAAGLATLGFCVLFNIRKKYIAVPALGGLLCWAVYLLLQSMSAGVFLSTLMTAVIVGIYGELFAHIIKVPTTVLFIPACVPLIPGSNLYYLALAMISSDWDKCIENLVLLSLYAVGIALGLAIVSELEKMLRKVKIGNRLFRIGVFTAMLTLVVGYLVIFCLEKTINKAPESTVQADDHIIHMADYVIITSKGYEGVGTAAAEIDWGALAKRDIQFADGFTSDHTPLVYLEMNLEVILSKDQDLSSGEMIQYEVRCHNDSNRNINCQFEGLTGYYQVGELEEITERDLFSYLDVGFSGISPCVKLDLWDTRDQLAHTSVAFQADKVSDLKNGDVVTITCAEDEYYLKKVSGNVLAVNEKQYTVRNMPEYVTSYDTLTEQQQAKLLKDAVSSISTLLVEYSDSVPAMEYAGAIFCETRDYSRIGRKNRLSIIYKVTQKIDRKNYTFYYPVTFWDLYTEARFLRYSSEPWYMGGVTDINVSQYDGYTDVQLWCEDIINELSDDYFITGYGEFEKIGEANE